MSEREQVPKGLSQRVVVVRCISCKAIREICAGEIEKGDMPFCGDCFSVMVAVRAETMEEGDCWPDEPFEVEQEGA